MHLGSISPRPCFQSDSTCGRNMNDHKKKKIIGNEKTCSKTMTVIHWPFFPPARKLCVLSARLSIKIFLVFATKNGAICAILASVYWSSPEGILNQSECFHSIKWSFWELWSDFFKAAFNPSQLLRWNRMEMPHIWQVSKIWHSILSIRKLGGKSVKMWEEHEVWLQGWT